MGGEHRADIEAGDGLGDILGAVAASLQFFHGPADGSRLRRLVPKVLMMAPSTSAVDLLRRVDEQKIERKRTRGDSLRFEGQRGNPSEELPEPGGTGLTAPTGAARPPQLFDGVEGLASGETQDRTPERGSDPTHVVIEAVIFGAVARRLMNRHDREG